MQVLAKPTSKEHYLPFLKERPKIKSLINRQPNVYLQSKQKKKNKSQSALSSKIYEYVKNSNKNNSSRYVLREALTKNIAFDHIDYTHSKFLSSDIINSVLEPVKALNYKTQQFTTVFQIIKDIFGQDFEISEKQILASKGQITKKFYIFFTSTYYRPFSFCCNSPIYLTIFKSNQVNQIFKNNLKFATSVINPQQEKDDDYRIDFICSECKKKVLKLKELSQKQVRPKQLILSRKSQRQQVLDQERQKISMTIMIASGRYKKLRINESNVNLRYNRSRLTDNNTSVQKDHSKNLIRIKSQIMTENINETQKVNKLS